MPDFALALILLSAGAFITGLGGGWLLRGARNNAGLSDDDWKLRLEARDRDLREAQDRMTALIRAVGSLENEMDGPARLIALDEELRRAEEELDRLRALEIDRNPAAGSMARRLEELEVELATLESMRCPEPAAHRRMQADTG